LWEIRDSSTLRSHLGEGRLEGVGAGPAPLDASQAVEKVKRIAELLGRRMCDEPVENLRPRNEQTRNLLERHRAVYAEVTGRPFPHFFRPIMFEDTPAQLIRGPIINEAFEESPGAWVVQRGAVDHLFGGFFEGDFEITQHRLDATPMDCPFNKTLYAAILPTLSRPVVACGADLVAQTNSLG
jgi:hypothetical protein